MNTKSYPGCAAELKGTWAAGNVGGQAGEQAGGQINKLTGEKTWCETLSFFFTFRAGTFLGVNRDTCGGRRATGGGERWSGWKGDKERKRNAVCSPRGDRE